MRRSLAYGAWSTCSGRWRWPSTSWSRSATAVTSPAARMVGQGADAPYTQSFAVVHRLRDGLIVEADYYLDRAQALQAVGLAG